MGALNIDRPSDHSSEISITPENAAEWKNSAMAVGALAAVFFSFAAFVLGGSVYLIGFASHRPDVLGTIALLAADAFVLTPVVLLGGTAIYQFCMSKKCDE